MATDGPCMFPYALNGFVKRASLEETYQGLASTFRSVLDIQEVEGTKIILMVVTQGRDISILLSLNSSGRILQLLHGRRSTGYAS